jgi:mono/diheme cytochrome c family protein
MNAMSRTRNWAVLLTAALSLTLACQFEPPTPELRFSLNTEAIEGNADLADDANAQEHLLGALEFLFGTPSNPSYMVLPDWADAGFDPNYWGQDLLSDEAFEALEASNAAAYAEQIATIEAASMPSDLDGMLRPRYAPDLWQSLLDLREEMGDAGLDDVYDTTDDGEEITWRDEAIYRFTAYYPSLRTTAEMYRQQCFHCHGAEGGGNGSTSDFLDPRPRDYRPGIFKFTALDNKARPRHEDLVRILEEGVYTTAMPSFRRFTDAQLSGLADYVRLLAVRGETEILMITDFDPDEGFHFENLQENYELVVDRWNAAADEVIVYDGDVPRSTPERVARGRDLFMRDDAANCVKCHGETGRGDGESVKNNPEDATDDWGDPILPRDMTRGVFRFGRRPIDLYRRVYAGINGTPMPAHYDMQITDFDGSTRPLNEEDVWDLVFYVRSLSDEPMHATETGAEEAGH